MKSARESKKPIPTIDAFNKCKDTATTPEAANYAFQAVKQLLKTAGAAYDVVVQAFSELAKFADLKDWGNDPWSGKPPLSNFESAKLGNAAKTAIAIKVSQPLRFDFAVSDGAKLVRAFSINGKAIDPTTSKAMNDQLSAWLAKDKAPNSKNEKDKLQLVSDKRNNGQLYVLDANEPDKIKKQNGKPVIPDAEAVRRMLVDPNQGFAQFVQKQTKNATTIDTHSHNFADHEAAEKARAETTPDSAQTPG